LKKKIATNKLIKQEGHDGPEIAHLYIGPWEGLILTQGLFFNQLGRHPLEDVS
jgi:hypothetical protein